MIPDVLVVDASMALTREDVISRLHEITDPCSAATKVPLSIVEMGMVENVELTSGKVFVALRMTSPLCHALPLAERRELVSSHAARPTKTSS